MYLKDVIDTTSKIKFNNIKLNSRNVEKGDLFIPFKDVENKDIYIKDALSKKCSCIITDKEYPFKKVFVVTDLEKEIISIFNKYYHNPLKNIKLIGVTGTDGKTSIASILSDLLNCPSIGTNGFKFKGEYYPLLNTTPSLDVLYSCFNKSRGEKEVVMEVSSEAYLTKRIGELMFDLAILTDITKDHLDKHKSLENYINSKLQLFKHSKVSILNRDSMYYNLFKKNSQKSFSYGFFKDSDLRILSYKLYFNSSRMTFKYKNKKYKIVYPLVGKFNVYNVACCILCLITLGYDMDSILERIKAIKQVKGRMDLVYNEKFKVMIDYAHTTNATLNVLKFIRKFNKNIISVVGCAGERYKEKRHEIGSIVLKYSKFVIFTMDDPRNEDPNCIIKEMIGSSKKKNYSIIIDREKAIEEAFSKVKKGGIILLLGKGSDSYMALLDKKIPYSDYNTVFDLLKKL